MSSLQKRAEAAADPETVAAEPPRLTHPEIRFVFYGLMLGGFLQALNQTIVASALPTIGRDLNDFQNLSWVVIAYLLSSTIVAPLYGKLADIHGRRGMMLVALGLFVAGSVLCAVAPDMATLIAGRTLQGIGGGGIVPMVQITVADMVTPRERGRYQAYMGTAWITAGTRRPRARRHHRAELALVDDLLAQRAARPAHRRAAQPVDEAAAAGGPQAQARLPRRGAGDGGGDAVSARAHHRRHARAVALADDLCADRRLDPAHRRGRLVAQARAGAVPAAQRAGQSGDEARHRGDELRDGRDDRLHDLHAALLPDRAQAHADAGRARASSR